MTVSGIPSGTDRTSAQRLRSTASAVLICVTAVLALAAFATAAQAISPAAADRAALRALGSERGDAPVIVFRQGRPLAPGTVVRQAGAARAAAASSAFAPNTPVRRDRLRRAGATVTRAPQVARVGGEAAWLYYEDRAPFQLYEHPGRVALVGVDSGAVRVSASFEWPPLVAGRLPLYLRNAVAYRDRRYRVFTRLPRVGSARTSSRDTTLAARVGADRAAGALARERACAVTVADMLGNAYDFASVDRTRAAVGSLLADLERRDRGFVAARYSTRDGLTPSAFVTRLIARHGCRSVLLFIAGGGVRGGQPTISLGASGHADGRLEQQDLGAAELRALLRAHPKVDWQLLVDAPYAGGLVDALGGEPNLRVLLTAGEADEPTYACIPGGRSLCPPGSGAAQLAFSSRVLTGIDALLSDPGSVDRAKAAVAGGAPFLGSLLTEGFSRGEAAAKLRPLGVHPRRFVNFPRGGGTATPEAQTLSIPPFASDQRVTTDEDRAISIDLANGPVQALIGWFSIARPPAHGRLSDVSFPTGRYVTYTPDPDFNGTDSFQFRVTVGLVLSTTATVTITVRPVADAPVVTTSAGTTAFTEGDGARAVDPALTVRDVDSADLAGATVAIASGYVSGEDSLTFTDTPAIRGSWNAARGVLTLTGRAPVADYQRALRTVAYANASRDPRAGPRGVAFTVTDGALTSAAATKTVDVRAIADPPSVTLGGAGATYRENDPAVVVDGAVTITDPDSTELSGATVQIVGGLAAGEDVLDLPTPAPGGLTASYDAATGTLSVTGRATLAQYAAALSTVTYRDTSEAPSTAQRTIRFTVTDAGGSRSAPAATTVDVIAVNDAPTAGDDAYNTDEGVAVVDPAPGVLANDRDLDGDPLTVVAVDGAGANVGSATATARGGSVTIDADGALRYDPSGVSGGLRRGESVVDSITYTVADGNGGRATATVTFTVTAVNDAPLAADDDYRTDEDTPLTIAAPGVLGNDSDPDGDALTVDQADGAGANVGASFRSARGATVLLRADGALSYDPASAFDALRPGDEARDTITYRVTDGNGGTDTATITITISGTNDAPVAADDDYRTDEDTPLTIAAPGVLGNDNDPDGGALTVSEVDGSAANVGATFRAASGALVTIAADGAVSYDPNGRFDSLRAGQTVDDTVTYEVSDGDGGTDTATIRFTLTGVNDRPDAVDDAISTDEDAVATVSAPGLLRDDSDLDGDALAVDQVDGAAGNVGRAFRTARGATLSVNADGSLSYDPTGVFDALRPGEQASDSFTYRVSDGNGGTDTATVAITIDGVNDAPSAAADSYDGVGNTTLVVSDPVPAGEAAKQLTGSVQDNDSDPDNDRADLSIRSERVSSRLGGLATIQSDGSFTYVPPAGATGTSDSFAYSITDGSATSSGTVTVRLANRVWYVDNSEAAGGSGRSSDAFDTLAEATAASSAGDTIFVHTGDGGTTGQNAGAVLDANERLIGEADDLVVGGDTLYDGAAARRPSIGNAAGAGVALASGSTVQGLSIGGSGGAAIAGRSGVAGSTIADVTLTGDAGGLALTSTSGTFTVSDVSVNVSGGTALAASSAGTVNLVSAGTIALRSSGGRAVDVSGTTLGGTIDSATAGGAAGGVALQNTTGAIAFGDVAVNVSGGTGFLADNVAGLSVPAAGTVTVADSGGTAVAVRNSTAPNVTFDTVSATGAGTVGIDVTGNRGGGATTFSGVTTATTGAGAGVNLDSNGGHAIAFDGALTVATSSGAGFSATRGGTVTVTGAGSTVRSTTGTPLRIDSTTIGAADATFQSISANGAANGIVLNQTGSSGNLAVTGTGAAGSGGTITNIRGADGSTAGIGVYLNQTSGPQLRSLALSNNDGWAVRGTSVAGLSLDDTTIGGANGTNDSFDEGSVYLTDPTGTTGITDSAISGAVEDNVHVNATTGALDLTFSGNDVGANSDATGGNALLVETRGAATTNRTTISGNQFRGSREDLVQATTTDQANATVSVTGNRLVNGQATQLSGADAVLLQTAGNGSGATLRYLVQNNDVSGTTGIAVLVQKAPGIASAQGRIDNNRIGLTGVANSGSSQASGIVVDSRGQGTHTAAVTNNTVRQVRANGISVTSGEVGAADNGTVTVNATVTGNTVSEPAIARTQTGFRSEMADPLATVNECLDLQGNVLTGAGPLSGDIRVLHEFPQNTVRLPGYAGGAQDSAAVESYLAGRNTAATINGLAPGSGPGFVNAGAGCPQPS